MLEANGCQRPDPCCSAIHCGGRPTARSKGFRTSKTRQKAIARRSIDNELATSSGIAARRQVMFGRMLGQRCRLNSCPDESVCEVLNSVSSLPLLRGHEDVGQWARLQATVPLSPHDLFTNAIQLCLCLRGAFLAATLYRRRLLLLALDPRLLCSEGSPHVDKAFDTDDESRITPVLTASIHPAPRPRARSVHCQPAYRLLARP